MSDGTDIGVRLLLQTVAIHAAGLAMHGTALPADSPVDHPYAPSPAASVGVRGTLLPFPAHIHHATHVHLSSHARAPNPNRLGTDPHAAHKHLLTLRLNRRLAGHLLLCELLLHLLHLVFVQVCPQRLLLRVRDAARARATRQIGKPLHTADST